MPGAINFRSTDIYGGYAGTTESTIPEANDQMSLVDDQKAASAVSEVGQKTVPIFAAVLLIAAIALLVGVVN